MPPYRSGCAGLPIDGIFRTPIRNERVQKSILPSKIVEEKTLSRGDCGRILSLGVGAGTWTAITAAAAIPAAALAAWQLRVQILEHRERRRHGKPGQEAPPTRGALPVAPPLGRLPADVRGRDPLLAELRHSLRRWKRRRGAWVITGMGGIGKSTIALAIAESARTRGWQIWWITATGKASLAGGMLEVLGRLGAPESVTALLREDEPTAPDRAWEFIARVAGRRWLLVFDDADNPSVLAGADTATPGDGTGWLRTDVPGMLIVTTRHQDQRTWGRKAVIRELGPLDEDMSADVLNDLAPHFRGDRGEARDLAHRLGGLPLALHLAGSYLASPFARWHSFRGYLEALDSSGLPAALADLDDPGAQARTAVTRTWELSLDALAADGRPQTRPLLFLLSCYAPAAPIPEVLLRPDLLSALFIPGPGGSASEYTGDWQRRHRDAALYGLGTVGLIKPAGDGTVTVHPVVADVNRSRLLTTAKREFQAISTTAVSEFHAACDGLDPRRPADWPAWRSLVPHMAAALAWLGGHLDDSSLERLIAAADMTTTALWRSGDYATAERVALSCLDATRRLSDDHPARLSARAQLAHVVAVTQHAEAEQMFRDLLRDQQRVLGGLHPDTMASQRVLARLTGLQGQYQEAEAMYRELIADRRLRLGDDHVEILHLRHGLAGMVERQGRHEEAESRFRALLDDQRRILGDDHQECLEIRSGLGRSIEDQGRYDEAEHMYRQLLADRQRILGDDHPSTLDTCHSLARAVAAQGHLKEAKQIYHGLLADRQRILGEDHPLTLATREFLMKMTENGNLAGQPGVAPMEALMHSTEESPRK
jgi:tetratricopeptide (TPR) repeat protein